MIVFKTLAFGLDDALYNISGDYRLNKFQDAAIAQAQQING